MDTPNPQPESQDQSPGAMENKIGKFKRTSGRTQAYHVRELAYNLALKVGTGKATESEKKAARDVTGLIRAWGEADEDIRHCREVAPTPAGLKQIEFWLRTRNEHGAADVLCFLAFSGLRIGEALTLDWEAVDWGGKLLHVQREKRGITPWVPILPEMEALLRDMQKRASSHLLFPSPFKPNTPRDDSAVRHRLTAACRALGLGTVTPHGLRSYFVTQARQSGLTDAEIAMLIGDKTGPAIIAHTYGDVRPDHLLKQAQRIRLTVQGSQDGEAQGSSNKDSNMLPSVSPSFGRMPEGMNANKALVLQEV